MSGRIGRRLSGRRLARESNAGFIAASIAGAGLLILCGCGGANESDGGPVSMDIVEPPLVVATRLHARSEWTVADTFAFFRATDLLLLEDDILVGDSGNDRLVLFDEELVPLRTIGREGAGPGELRQPFRIRAGGRFLVASELGNSRFSFFHRDGTFSHVVPRLGLEGVFDLTSDGSVYRASMADGHYLFRVGSGGDTASIAPIPAEVRALRKPGADAPRWRSDLVVATEGDTLHVFDNQVGALIKLDPGGRVHAVRTLPETLRRGALEKSENLHRSLSDAGHRVLASPLAAHLSVTGEGDLFLRLTYERVVGLLIDPHSYSVRFVYVPAATGDWAPVSQSLAAAVRDSTLFVLGTDGIASFRLREESN